MISHKYKCIFIHISKCAGSTVEHAFGINTVLYEMPDYQNLFGWCEKNQFWLQHAMPQQLLDCNLISKKEWNSYYKFIIYRNSWSRAQSDYNYLKKKFKINDTFSNYLDKQGKFFEMLHINGRRQYVGEHLYCQKPYFFLDGERINYDQEVDFDNLELGFQRITQDLSLPNHFFNYHVNKGEENNVHYSLFYNSRMKRLVEKKYEKDIDFFDFKFEDKKSLFQKIKKELNLNGV